MTEQELLDGKDVQAMLEFVHDKASDRKFRLFACACCRLVWSLLANEHCRRAVEISERAADDPSAMTELATACKAVWDANRDARGFSHPEGSRKGAAYMAAAYASTGKMWHVAKLADCTRTLAARSSFATKQFDILCDILGPIPFHPFAIDPAWLSPTVSAVARTIYERRQFRDMPVLSDALQEAGCTDPDILQHCRGPGPHVKGCWLLDLLLAKS